MVVLVHAIVIQVISAAITNLAEETGQLGHSPAVRAPAKYLVAGQGHPAPPDLTVIPHIAISSQRGAAGRGFSPAYTRSPLP